MSLRIKKEEQLKIIGMHCATCVNTVTKSLKSVNGVIQAQVNLASGLAKVEHTNVKLKDLVKAVRSAGYDVLTEKVTFKVSANPETFPQIEKRLEELDGVVDYKSNPALGTITVEFNPLQIDAVTLGKEIGFNAQPISQNLTHEDLVKMEYRDLLRKLIVGAIFTPFVVIFAVLRLPILSMIFSVPVQFYSGLRYHKGAYIALKNATTNMDVLVSLASNIMWFSSVYFLFEHLQTFFDASALLITFVLVGKTVEAYIKARVSSFLTSYKPSKARLKDGEMVDVSSLKVGDIVVVKSGEEIPADGVVEDGKGEVNESIFTGESTPVLKKKGDPVLAGSVLVNGYLEVYVTRPSERSYISQVEKLVREAYSARVSIQSLVDKVSEVFVPVIITVAILTFIVWHFILGYSPISSMLFSVAVLAAACPCALGLASPMAVLVRVNNAVKRGIIIRNGDVFERFRLVDTIVFDKTGTLTEGTFKIKDYKEYQEGAMKLVSAAESKSNHPIARAFERSDLKVSSFEEFPGEGIYANVNGHDVIVGKESFVKNNCDWNVNESGDVLACIDGKPGAIINIEDRIKEDAFYVISELKKRKIRVIMATGDSSKYADEVGKRLGIEVFKGLTPNDKVELVKRLKSEGYKVAFIGDGINDAEAIKEAFVGIAVSNGTELAKYAGDVIIKDLKDILTLLSESNLAVRKIKENLGWAFGYNAVLVPIAAGVLYPRIYLPPEYAALAMAFSSVIVSLWSLVPI